MDKSLKRCQIHNKQSRSFCKTCKRVNCIKCEGCEEHERVGINKIIEENKDFLQPIYFKGYKVRAEEATETTKNKLARTKCSMATHVKEMEKLEKAIPNSKNKCGSDSKLVGEAIDHLREIQEKAFTTVLKEAVETAIHTLDIDTEIEEEISGYPTALGEHKKNIKRLEEEAKNLEWKLEWLDTITKADESKVDEVELAMSLCFTNGIITFPGAVRRESDFIAFPSVSEVFDIDRVEREELVDVGLGVKVSKPVVVERGLIGENYMISSLSHNGILAIYYYETGYKYQLRDLVNEKQIEIEVENSTHTGFYDDSMVVLTSGRPLGVCSVEEMFLKKNVSVLRKIGDVKVYHFADVTLLHSTRVLVFFSISNILYEFNVDTKVIRELNIWMEVSSFASLTGIDVGVKGVFKDKNNNFTYSLNNDNSTSLMLGCNTGSLCTFIPSSSNPRDIKKGTKIYHNGSFFTHTTEGAQLTTPFKYQYYQSIVRLYQDIFLVYDANTKKWCLVKILVP